MHMHFKWDDNAGDTRMSPRSNDSIAARFAESDHPIDVLDFLRDVVGIATQEYNAALSAYHARIEAKIKARSHTTSTR